MSPEFTKKTVEIIAKRSAYHCSNPDCRILTVGPNSDPCKALIIGEAAHIFGARPSSARYMKSMLEANRADITNSIWLCRNCHKLIDSDSGNYSPDILFRWREEHEKFASSALGSISESLEYAAREEKIAPFLDYPPLVRRILRDEPLCWEYRLTAEIMRYLNAKHFQRIRDLRDGLYIKEREDIGDEEIIRWVQNRLNEASGLFKPVEKLLDRLTLSWGELGEPGDSDEIQHVCILISDYLEQVVNFEERTYFVRVPEDYEDLVVLLQDLMGTQAEKLSEIPAYLDDIGMRAIAMHESGEVSPLNETKTISFSTPKGWSKKFDKELKRISKKNPHRLAASDEEEISSSSSVNGWLAFFIVVLIFYWIF